ncbi:MAG: YggS family pyridoxal phosphate-dependent enzyme [Pseudomonadales bacterium]
MNSTSIAENISQVSSRIRAAENAAGRIPGIVQLIAVSKTRTANEVRKAVAAGARHIGENYLQEALDKQSELAGEDIVWHFIGPIQSNKTSAIANHFDWVHSIDRLKIARRLNDQRETGKAPLNVCIQVNISDETTKSGVPLAELPALAKQIAELPNLKLRGLMAIPSPNQPEASLTRDFARMKQSLAALNRGGLELDTLSMGMSGDLEAAIAAGSTMVRIGTAIFGPRNYSTTETGNK